MTEHITGQQARELLDGTTPGPWEWAQDGRRDWECIRSGEAYVVEVQAYDPAALAVGEEDIDLIVAAPALAETVAWLYGREPQQSHASGEVFHCAEEEDNDLPWAVAGMPGEVSVTPTDRRDLTPDEAVDLARALLAAAEKARRHTD